MLFVLDSSILCSNFHMTGPSFEILRRIGILLYLKSYMMKYVINTENY